MQNKLNWFIALSILFAPCWTTAGESSRGPEASLPENVFEFKPVVEGIPVVHEFILHNRGDETLTILDLKSG